MAFSDRILERAKADKRTIVLAEGFDKRVVQAAGMAQATRRRLRRWPGM